MDTGGIGGRALLGLALAFATLPPAAPRPEPRPDIAAAISATVPDWPRRDVEVTVTLKNLGDAPAPKSACFVYVRNANSPRQTVRRIKKAVRELAPGDQFAFSFKLQLSLGMYEVEAVADPADKVREADEGNNKARIMLSGR
jgi:subtilase family serine protease